MTLYRQLLLYSLIILLFLCAGVWLGDFSRARSFFENYLASRAQDAATSLGLSLSVQDHRLDGASMEKMAAAIFDQNYYQRISIRDVTGTTLIERSDDASPALAPKWFTRFVGLRAPEAEAPIMRGWQRVGTVTVICRPGFAYAALWQSLQNASLWLALSLAVVAVFGGLGLKRLLKPLRGIEEQAIALCERRFPIQENIPKIREMRRVVLAINLAARRIGEMFAEQAAMAEDLQQRLHRDSLTGVGNRHYLESQIVAKAGGENVPVTGVFLLVQIQDLQGINQRGGYQVGDQLLKTTAEIISQICRYLPQAVIARLNGGDFALLLPDTDMESARNIAGDIVEDIAREAKTVTGSPAVRAGGVIYDRAISSGQLLADADRALGEARASDKGRPVLTHCTDGGTAGAIGRLQWQDILRRVINERAITFFCQPAVAVDERSAISHYEILTRVCLPGEDMLPFGMCVPTAERLGLMPVLDKLVIEELLRQPLDAFTPAELAINLSPVSLSDGNFAAWLRAKLREFSERGLRINFEFPEFRLRRHSALLKEFAAEAKKSGHAVGFDHFGQGLMPLGYLSQLLPDYVKIDYAFISHMEDKESGHCFINTLCTVAHSLGIKVMATGVESEEQRQELRHVSLDTMQGYLVAAPKPIPGVAGSETEQGA